MAPHDGDIMSRNDRIFSWARFFTPLVIGLVGAAISGFAVFLALQFDVRRNSQTNDLQDARLASLEAERTINADRFARLEVKIDLLLDEARKR